MLQILFDFFSGKAKTRIYTTFLGWLLIFHIDILFIALFTDQGIIYQKTGQLKAEYLWSYITYLGWWTIALEVIRIVMAVLLTYLMIWIIPKILNQRSYKIELEVEYILRKMKVDKEENLNKREKDVVTQQLSNIEKEKKVVAEKAKLEEAPEQVRWDVDFESFKDSIAFGRFGDIIETVYEYGGFNSSRDYSDRVDVKVIAYLDSNEIIVLDGEKMSLTSKGRYFVKKYTEGPAF